MPVAPLPIDSVLPELMAALRVSKSAVLVAPPGAGKTTRLPPALLKAGLLSREYPNLVMLQPRRVAARAAATRIAAEQGWTLGQEVGYHVRFDRKISRDTRIRVLTEGILTRQLLDQPDLPGIGAVLLDEFHERSLHTDIAIALLREVQQSLRPDLILLVMSATLSAEPVAKFLDNAPIVRSEGRMFPIDVRYTPKPMQPGWAVDEIPTALATLINDPKDDAGDVLVFLPGMEEIRRTQKALAHGLTGVSRAANDLLVLPLHGSLTADEQDLALRSAEQRKIILATNIAETSLTIEGVTNVIDTGLARLASYDAERGLDRLDLTRISRASADQRAGRAGRTAPGRCVRLWSEKEHHALAAFNDPEISRVDLAGTVLSLHAWGVNPRTFGWFEPPSEAAIDTAETLLEMLGAIERPAGRPASAGRSATAPSLSTDRSIEGARTNLASGSRAEFSSVSIYDADSTSNDTSTTRTSPAASSANDIRQPTPPARITPLGHRMVNLPMHPRLARLLVAAQDAGLSREGAALAAMLSEKDILPFEPDRDARRASVTGDSDVLYRLQRLEAGDRSLDHAAVRQVNAARHQFLQSVEKSTPLDARLHPNLLPKGEGTGESPANRSGSRTPRTASSLPPGESRREGDRRIAPLDARPHPNLLPKGEGTGESPANRSGSRAPRTAPSLPPGESRSEGERRSASPADDASLQKLILLAYPDRVCKRRPSDPTQAVMVGGGGVRIGPESIVASAEYFIAIDARHDSYSRQQQAIVRIASAIEPAWLEEFFPQSIRRETTAELDEQRGRVIGVRRTRYRDLTLKQDIVAVDDEHAAAVALANAITPKLESLLREDEHLAPLVARIQLLAEHLPDHPWPAISVAGLIDSATSGTSSGAQLTAEATSPQWVIDACTGVRSLDDAKRKLPQALRDQLVYPLDRLLDQHAPETIEVPTGNKIRIDYRAGQRPVLAVRLQEIFGWLDTPRIANGRVPLLMHLLGPNYRPVQITDDLRSFWSGTYFQVRKDLKVRYPKHSWPDDPLTATPQAKGRNRR